MNKLLLAAQLSVQAHKYYAVIRLSATEMEKTEGEKQ